MDTDAQVLISRLLAWRHLPTSDPLVRRVLTDDDFRADVETRLSQCGLQLLSNPYAAHVAVGLRREMEQPVFDAGSWQSTNVKLNKDELSLLVVIWARVILPKRRRQNERSTLADHGQQTIAVTDPPIPQSGVVSEPIAETALAGDLRHHFTPQRLRRLLTRLAGFGFIVRKNEQIHEGPLLDVLIDYATLAPRILDGTLKHFIESEKESTQAALEDGQPE